MRSKLVQHAQRLYFLWKDGRTLTAHWVEYSLGDTRRTKLTVYRLERLLLPRTGLCLGLVADVYDVALDDVEVSLAERGYEVTSRMDG